MPVRVGTAAALASAPLAPLHPAAREVLLDASEQLWADPAALHASGRLARASLDAAREAAAAVFGVRVEEVHFHTSGSEAAQTALLGVAASRVRVGPGIVVSAVEHAAVLHAARWAGAAREVPVDGVGRVGAAAFAHAASGPGVAIASLQSANGETGVLQPLAEVAELVGSGVPLHSDVSAAVGRHAVSGLPVDHVTADARAFGGPPGVGFRCSRLGSRWRAPGPDPAVPPPVPLIVAAVAALAAVESERADLTRRLAPLTARLRSELPRLVPDLLVAGPEDAELRLPHLLTVSALYVDGEALVLALDRVGVGAASGSACTAHTLEPSHVLAAMGFLTQGNLRIALGREAGEADVDRLLQALPLVVAALRAGSGVTGL